MSSSEQPMKNLPVTVTDAGERNTFSIGSNATGPNHNANAEDQALNTAVNPVGGAQDDC